MTPNFSPEKQWGDLPLETSLFISETELFMFGTELFSFETELVSFKTELLMVVY